MKDLGLIVFAWFMTALLQLFAMPILITRLRNTLFDAGWAFGRLLTWLVLALPVWVLAHFGFPVNNQGGLFVVFLLFAVLSIAVFHLNKDEIVLFLQERWKWLMAEEILFAAGFFFLCVARGFGPDINDLEKFMDAGLMASYLRAPTLPVLDMWFAGETMNYYTFGHFLGSVMTRYWSLELPYSYNLLLGFIMGLFMAETFSVVLNLIYKSTETEDIGKPLIWGSAVAAVLVAFAGNTHAIWYGIKNHGWKGYWYPDATRFIPQTIHEFPSYSLIVGDLHAHVWDFPLAVSLLLCVFLWYHGVLVSERAWKIYPRALATGMMLGVCFMTSAWSGGVYALLLCLCGMTLTLFYPSRFGHVCTSLTLIGAVAAGVSSLWWTHFRSISSGVRWVEDSSDFWRLLVVWGGIGILSLIAFWVADHQNRSLFAVASALRRKKQGVLGFILALIIAAWVLILIPEIIYVKDIYPEHPRANTMFKFTLQSFIFMGIATGWVAGFIWLKDFIPDNKSRKGIQSALTLVISLTVCLLLIFPYFGYRDRYGFKNFKGLNGLNWLKEKYPEDYAGILWLNAHVSGQPVILEAVGTSYSDFSRVSAFTGLPTVVGWPVHEWLWRGSYDIPAPRIEDVKSMYEQPFSLASARMFEKYMVDYIFVGDKEREAYPDLRSDQLRALGDVVFQNGGTFVVHRTMSRIMTPAF
ncbi:MAG TPA: DUF2298 domain-containing protein [Candidatus Omnitrophota bacterium]|jgi:uncharacterized membrane protein|nr:DUF2298 domain-containing protein [Candidatus Omnitrophota bacterium]